MASRQSSYFRASAATASIARPRPFLGEIERCPDDGIDGGRGAERLGHAGGHHRRRLQAIAPLVRAEDLDRLAVGIDGVAGVDDADRRGVHRRAAVDHVADAAQPGIGIRQPQPHQQPLLGIEEAIDQRASPGPAPPASAARRRSAARRARRR